jgi:hypothetical protein
MFAKTFETCSEETSGTSGHIGEKYSKKCPGKTSGNMFGNILKKTLGNM